MRSDLLRAARALGARGFLVAAVVVVGALCVPLLANAYTVSFALSVAMYVALTASWNILSGFAGYVSFGHVVFWGVGAYGCAVLVGTHDVPWQFGLLGGGVAAVALALLIGHPILKLSGVYFAISTLAVAEAVRVLITYARDVTGGGGGVNLLPVVSLNTTYYLMIAVAVLSVVFVYTLKFTRFGRSLVAIRENEVAAGSLGINTTARKIEAFVASSLFAGLAGAVYVLNVAFIDPGTAFDITITLRAIMMAMLGGIGTVLGSVLGPILFQVPSEWLWAQFPFVHRAVLGALIVAVVLVLPRGLVPAFQDLRRTWIRSQPRRRTPRSGKTGQDQA